MKNESPSGPKSAMALVNYPSSDSEEGYTSEPSTGEKRKRESEEGHGDHAALPPLPSEFHDLYASTARISTNDDPTLHGGRKRVTPHIPGNWATHVYLEWHPSATEHTHLTEILKLCQQPDTHSLLLSPLSAPVPLHISLSRPIVLVTSQRDQFLGTVETAVLASSVRPFSVRVARLEWFPNSEGTRWFLVLSVESENRNELDTLLDISNTAADSVGQPPLYQDVTNQRATDQRPSKTMSNPQKTRDGKASSANRTSDVINIPETGSHFHISIGWSSETPSPEAISHLQSSEVQRLLEEAKTFRVSFKDVKVKIGNTVTVIALPTKAGQGKGVLGY